MICKVRKNTGAMTPKLFINSSSFVESVKHPFDIRKYMNNNKNAIPLIVRYFVDFAAINIHLSLHLQ